MRGLLTSIIVLVALAVGVDFAVTRVAERRASEQASALLEAPATVDLQGWPVSLRVLLGSLEGVAVHAVNVPTPSGVRLTELDATVTDLPVRLADLASGRLPAGARDGVFTVGLDADAVSQVLADVIPADAIRIGDGVVAVEAFGLRVAAEVGVQDGQLVLMPVTRLPGLPSTISVALPDLPPGTTVQRATVRDGLLQLDGVFDPAALAGALAP